MSKIALTPNASGTGTLTIAAPNTNTDRTLTLPDASGNVVVNEGSGTFKIDASGNVGIGTSSPSFISTYGGLQVNGSNGTTIKLTNPTTGATSTDGFELILQAGGLEAYVWQRESSSLIFGTSATERARIDSSGRVGVGTSAPNGRVTVQAFGGVPSTNLNNLAITTFGSFGGGIAMIDSGNPNSGTGYGIWVDDSGNDFNIARGTTSSGATGGVYINDNAGSWSSRSDERDKINLEPITDAASKVQSLRAVMGEYIWAEGVRHPFLIAQDVQAVFPEAVSIANKSAPEEEQRLGMSYTDMVPLLTAALQEALADIATLKTEIAALKGASA